MPTTSQFVREAVRVLGSPSMHRFVARICDIPEEVDDVIQDAALKVVALDARGFAPRSTATAVAFVLVKHAAINRRVASRRLQRVHVTAASDPALAIEFGGNLFASVTVGHDGDAFEAAPDRDIEAEIADAFDVEQALGWVAEALDSIEPRFAEQLRLTYLTPDAPTAKQRGVPFGTAVSRTSRAKDAIRLKLQRQGRLEHVQRVAAGL